MIVAKKIIKEFPIKADPEGVLKVKIRQGTWGEDKERADVYTTQRTVVPINEGEHPIIEENYNRARKVEWEIRTVLSGISGLVDERGNDITPFVFKEHKNGYMKINMSPEAFSDAIDSLGSEVVEEIHDYVLEMNPTWGTPRAKKKENEEAEKKDDPTGESSTTSGK